MPNQRNVVTELHSDSGCRLDAGVGEQADYDDLLFVIALQLLVENGVRKAAERPMFRRNNIAREHFEAVVKRSTPRALGKGLSLCRSQLVGQRVFPVDVVARLPSMVGHVEDSNARLSRRPDHGPQVLQQVVFLRNMLSFAMSFTHGKSFPFSLRKSLYRSTHSTAVILGSYVMIEISLNGRKKRKPVGKSCVSCQK
jgi:hypothetical protein